MGMALITWQDWSARVEINPKQGFGRGETKEEAAKTADKLSNHECSFRSTSSTNSTILHRKYLNLSTRC